MTIPAKPQPSSPANNAKKPAKTYSLRPDQNRGPAQKPNRSQALPGARRVNKTQGR
jgi:hypothetical protein